MRVIRPNHYSKGFTFLEALIAMVVLSIALMGTASLILSSSRLNHDTAEDITAVNAANSQMERMLSASLPTAFTLNGTGFTINNPKLRPWRPLMAPQNVSWSEATGRWTNAQSGAALNQGTIIFPNADAATPLTIDENVQPATIADPQVAKLYTELGCPRDLNGNGTTTDVLLITDPALRLLPVIVSVEWETPDGLRKQQLLSVLLSPRQ